MNNNLKIFCVYLIIDLLLIQTSDQRSVLYRDEELPPINDLMYETPQRRFRSRLSADVSGRAPESHFGDIYVKLSIFYDKYLLKKFDNDLEELKKFVSSIVYASQILFNRDNIRDFAYFKLLVVKYTEYPGEEQNITKAFTGIVGNNHNLLDDFCKFVNKNYTFDWNKNDRSNAALLLTGLNIWSDSSARKIPRDRDLGMAYQSTICAVSSCAIVEAREFYSVSIFTHELAHMLGVQHDGEKGVGCHPLKYIMTAKYSLSRIKEWSECSAQQLKDILKTKWQTCMKNKTEVVPGFDFSKTNLPGVEWPADKQCQMALGPTYRALVIKPFQDVCRSLACRTENEWYQREKGYPALEGTLCGSKWINGKELLHYCRSDECTTKRTSVRTDNRINDLNSNDSNILT